jgi:hypothetical protein
LKSTLPDFGDYLERSAAPAAYRCHQNVRVEHNTQTCHSGTIGNTARNGNPVELELTFETTQKLRNRKSLALASTFSLVTGSGIMRAISTAPIIVEKITKKARSLSAARRPGMNRSILSL